ncbi:MAG TPA: hypothetical protein VMM36_12785, partial [Opitutaceae bacterium]|nr:hypothetical protein [Opitutaceae bacterium]
MRTRAFLSLAAIMMLGATALPAQTLDESLQKAATDYRERVSRAADELNRARTRIAAEKVPLLEQMRAAQNRVIASEGEATRFETQREDFTEQRRKLVLELDAVRKTARYVHTLASDGLRATVDGLAPGEIQFIGEEVQALQKQIESPDVHAVTAMNTADFLLARTERALGGFRATGQATIDGTNEVLRGTFAFVGPETFFRPASGGAPGSVRPREGSKFPVSYELKGWQTADA